MPNQVYRFDPSTGAVRVVATDFDKCNGIAFTPDGKTAFMCVFQYSILCQRCELASKMTSTERTQAPRQDSSGTTKPSPLPC